MEKENYAKSQPQPSKEWQQLRTQFESLCNEQDKLYKSDFEAVFKALFEIDSNQRSIYNTNFWDMGEGLPNEADVNKLQQALRKAGFANNGVFCKAFIDYANVTIRGKRLQREMAALNVSEVMSQQRQKEKTYGWQFIPISIIAPQEMHDTIISTYINTLESLNTIPTEDEEEDDYLMIEVYNCKSSIVPFVEELKEHRIIGSNSIFLNDTGKYKLLKTVKGCAIFIKDHTDTPAVAKNYIIKTLKEFDVEAGIRLIFQILTLQGLCRWLESVNINKGDRGFNEAQCFYDWLSKLLINKMVFFCLTLYSDNDKERLKPFCDYLMTTGAGKIVQMSVQKRLFGGEPQPEQEAAPQPTAQEPQQSDTESKQEQHKPTRGRGRPKKTIKDMMVNDKDGSKLSKIHSLMAGRAGKGAALIIVACIKKGWMQKPTFSQLKKEFVDIGTQQGFTKYLDGNGFTEEELTGAISSLD